MHYAHNYLGKATYRVTGDTAVPAGAHVLRFEFEPTGEMDFLNGKGTPGRLQLYIDGALVGNAEAPTTVPLAINPGLLTCGANPGSPVVEDYEGPFRFTGTDSSSHRRSQRRAHHRSRGRAPCAHGQAVGRIATWRRGRGDEKADRSQREMHATRHPEWRDQSPDSSGNSPRRRPKQVRRQRAFRPINATAIRARRRPQGVGLAVRRRRLTSDIGGGSRPLRWGRRWYRVEPSRRSGGAPRRRGCRRRAGQQVVEPFHGARPEDRCGDAPVGDGEGHGEMGHGRGRPSCKNSRVS